jgi:cytochrome c553
LLEPGFAGLLSPNEFQYIKSTLKESASLKRKWGFRPSARRLSEKHIREVAMHGFIKKQRPVLASAVKLKK